MTRGPGTLRDGTARCQPCRRARIRERPPRPPLLPLTCRCGVVFTPTTPIQKYCIPQHSPSWTRNKKPRERAGRSGHQWRKLRAQVLAEETHCWLCWVEVDKSLHHLDPGAPQVDHVVAIHAGGDPEDRANLRLAHKRCNQSRGRRVR
jgi:5-methylcytosine-specific restriction endonuclease McrA